MSSSTSSLLGHLSIFRNPTVDAQSLSYLKVMAAQCGYMVIVPYTIVEAAISQIVKAISSCLNLDLAKYQKIEDWAQSSAYSALWAIHSVFANLFVKTISATEGDFKAYIILGQRPKPAVSLPEQPEQPGKSNELPEQPETPVEPEPALVNPIPQPVIAVPTSKDPAIAKLLKGYRLADNAKRYSELMEKIYSEIPELDDLKLYGLVPNLTHIMKDRDNRGTRNKIVNKFNEIAEKIELKRPLKTWDERLFKMTAAIYDVIMKLQGNELENGKEILISGLFDAFDNCTNRQSTEIERLYFSYVAPDLLASVEAAATPEETLIFELMQYRIRIRDEIINRICADVHNAASHKYFREKLNEKVFFLPTPILCDVEGRTYDGFALVQNENAIIYEFKKLYENPNTIYDIFIGLLYPNSKDKFRFKPEMFIKWLEENGRMNADAFTDEECNVFTPEIVIAFLEEKGFFLSKKGQL